MSTRALYLCVEDFLQQHLDPSIPVLLALSGGIDSTALLHLLVEYQKRNPLLLHVVHIDHGWRQESAAEATQLQAICSDLGLPFHLQSLQMDPTSPNLEDLARQKRLQVFRHIKHTIGAQAVLTAHHQDDQVETVLKRVFEGAPLSRLVGMQTVTQLGGVAFWRPLLNVSKQTLADYLSKKGATYLIDRSNQNTHFLRTRLRQNLLPYLDRYFQKNVRQPLLRTAEESNRLSSYLDQQTDAYLLNVIEGPWGRCLDLSRRLPIHPVELAHLLRRFVKEQGCSLSQSHLQSVMEILQSGKANKQVEVGGARLYIDRKRVFYCGDPLLKKKNVNQLLRLGVSKFGSWEVTVVPFSDQNSVQWGWEALWRGRLSFSVPDVEGLYLCQPEKTWRVPSRNKATLNDLWTQHKVPAFLRGLSPTVKGAEDLLIDPLSKSRPNSFDAKWTVSLKLSK